jgi:NhaA family Na+:H+ antiporter
MSDQQSAPNGNLRVPWSRSERPVPRAIVRPLQSFLETEIASGVLLLTAAAVAQLWANAPGDTYERVWSTHLTIFLVVGLEIKREFLTGELRDRRAAVLPVFAAIGGMVVPALIYLAITAGSEGSRGWGVVMPTDIAFALGVLVLAAPRAPTGLRVFVLALAIVDDLGSIVVVALFYSQGVEWAALFVGAAILVAFIGLQRIHVRASLVYVVLGVGVWLAFHEAGISPTLAGVTLGLLTPAVPFQRPSAVSEEAHRVADETVDDPFPPDADAAQWLYLAQLSREAVSPLARVESVLHPWTSFVVVPLFALANAGIVLSGDVLGTAVTSREVAGIVAARVLGKLIGITAACWLAVRVGARLPAGASWRHVVGVAAAAGVPFTVSLFIAELAFTRSDLLEAAKVGIMAAGVLAGLVGFALLRRAEAVPGGAASEPRGG